LLWELRREWPQGPGGSIVLCKATWGLSKNIIKGNVGGEPGVFPFKSRANWLGAGWAKLKKRIGLRNWGGGNGPKIKRVLFARG